MMSVVFAPIGALVVGVLLVMLVGFAYGAIRVPDDPRDRIVLRIVGVVISASWLLSGALVLRAL